MHSHFPFGDLGNLHVEVGGRGYVIETVNTLTARIPLLRDNDWNLETPPGLHLVAAEVFVV
jgi:hypothetical protein